MKNTLWIFIGLLSFCYLLFSCGNSTGEALGSEGKRRADSLVLAVQPLLDSVGSDTSLAFFAAHLRGYQDFIREFYQKKGISEVALESMQKLSGNQAANYRKMYAFWLQVKGDEFAFEDTRQYFAHVISRFEKGFEKVIHSDAQHLDAALAELTEHSALYRISYLPEGLSTIKERYFKRNF